jgi:transitional endoplasmic reticulum ATPase
MSNQLHLSPVQQLAADTVLRGLPTGDVFVLEGEDGAGKSTILRHVRQQVGGAFVAMPEFLRLLRSGAAAALEEAFLELIETALSNHDLVILDDLHLITAVADSCNYPRTNLMDAALEAILAVARADGKTLIFAVGEYAPDPIARRCYSSKIACFSAADYTAICGAYLGTAADRLDFEQIHRFSPKLNAHQLRSASLALAGEHALDTERFMNYLSSRNLTSNVVIEEVARVDWNDLKGVDDVIRSLEAKVALPFENDALARELRLKPKRGVLLAGPPGTGKTTIGRALAHRLKSKFFLIDGTAIAGTHEFYISVRRVFEAAKRNAPAIVFIDDADVLFEGEESRGFYRYILTMLDGLESASAERVCVMMTAMDASALPAAVLRSGRVELWLETRLPDEDARITILRESLGKLPEPLGLANVATIASAGAGLTGADLKAVVEDAKLLFAYAKVTNGSLRPAEDYLLEAIDGLRRNRRNYAKPKPAKLVETVRWGFSSTEN